MRHVIKKGVKAAAGKAGLGAASVLTGALLTAPSLSAAQGNDFSLKLTGTSDVHVSGTCRVITGDQAQKHDIDQMLPFDLTFQGTSLTCQITASGPVSIEARDALGNRTRSQSSGGVMTFNLGGRS
ncbi:MAG: hypothetical protein AAF530_09325 [Pseudomonadota bacterium]